MSERVRFPALLGSHPLAALASFGLLRLVTDWDAAAKLGFEMEDDWITFVETRALGTVDLLLEKLIDWVNSDSMDHVLEWASGDVRVPPKEYRQVLENALKDQDILLAQFLGAFVADGAVDAQKGLIKPSAFYMVSGQQSFLHGLKDILVQVRANPRTIFLEALQGPWSYMTRLHGLGWDPNTERLYALRNRAPTAEKPSCIAGAVLLAFWALPLFPALGENGRARTLGFTRKDGGQFFSWPVFSRPIDLYELRSLLQVGESQWKSSDGKLRPGIETVFQSRRSEFGQGYAVFRPSQVSHRRDSRS
jgi:hypothetical protein